MTDQFSLLTQEPIQTGLAQSLPSTSYQTVTSKPPHTTLFSDRIAHNTASGVLAPPDQAFVANKLRDLLAKASITGHYSRHSFRRGAAT